MLAFRRSKLILSCCVTYLNLPCFCESRDACSLLVYTVHSLQEVLSSKHSKSRCDLRTHERNFNTNTWFYKIVELLPCSNTSIITTHKEYGNWYINRPYTQSATGQETCWHQRHYLRAHIQCYQYIHSHWRNTLAITRVPRYTVR
jgi:hypothetical protein